MNFLNIFYVFAIVLIAFTANGAALPGGWLQKRLQRIGHDIVSKCEILVLNFYLLKKMSIFKISRRVLVNVLLPPLKGLFLLLKMLLRFSPLFMDFLHKDKTKIQTKL